MEASRSPSEPGKRAYPEREATCETHGAYSSVNYIGNVWSGCSKCGEEQRQAAEDRARRAEEEERRSQRMALSGLEGRFADASFGSYKVTSAAQRAVVDACREYAKTVAWDSGAGLWLIGPPGVGKTHLGSAMVRYVIEERKASAAIYSGREIIRMLRSTWGSKDSGGRYDSWSLPTTEQGMIEMLGHTSLLVIDELGVSFGTDAEHVQLFDIIDERYKYRKPTVLLSNLDAADLKPVLGDRAYDRLREGAKLLACKWKSHRGAPPAAPSLEVVR